MSLHHAIERTSAVSHPTTFARPFLTFLYPALLNEPPRRCFSKSSVTRSPRLPRASKQPKRTSTDDDGGSSFFIHALTRAASCPKHAYHLSPTKKAPWLQVPRGGRRHQSTWNKDGNDDDDFAPVPQEQRKKREKYKFKGPIKRVKEFAKAELQALVDYYGPGFESLPEEVNEDNSLLIWNVGDDHQPWPFKNDQDIETVRHLQVLLKDEHTCHDQIYKTYKMLPAPGVVYLTIETIRQLLHHLSVVDRPTPTAMQRFLSVLDDMKTAHIHITRSEWTSAIYFAGRFMGTVHTEQVQDALRLWRDMEKRAGIRGGIVTMNVLFDIAVRAGKYALAETFLQEIKTRNIRFHRHFRVSLIYYYGVMQNSDAVRQTYHDLVAAGEPVDTVVLNAVIAALLRAGEPSAADHVFERMKRLDASKNALFSPDAPFTRLPFNTRIWRGRRALGIHLTTRSRQLARSYASDEEIKELQDQAPVAPDSRTYSLLIRHAARVVGDIDRVIALLREMGYNGVPVEGVTFIVIFHGFCSFGGVRYSSWTRAKLEQSWTEYLDAVSQGLERTWVSRMAVVSALKAFRKCGADKARLMQVWREAREVWKPDDEEAEAVLRVLGGLVRESDGGDGARM
ncbi:unnamed protein product [Periconia digitata]|uniref:Pentatricopeptide repeat-containing protein n=1 Tax=Periconia digitata TaxID=1303443 RepID=A0A9W4XUC7_9PLEO|nr:unnamed protein product [Periconia digitata]